MKKKRIEFSVLSIFLLLIVSISFLFTNDVNKTIIVEDGLEFALEFDKKEYSRNDKVKINAYVKNISGVTKFYTVPDTCIRDVSLSFGNDIFKFYKSKNSSSSSVSACFPTFTKFEIKPNEIIQVKEVLSPKTHKNNFDLLKNKDLVIGVTFDDINEDIEIKKNIPFKDSSKKTKK